MPTYEVTVWIESDGEPEDDPSVCTVVQAPNKHAAIEKVREHVRDHRKDLNYMKIWSWVVRKVYLP